MTDTDIFRITDRTGSGSRHANIFATGLDDVIMYVDEPGARDLVAKLTAWLDAPRIAARETPEVVASDRHVELLRTSADEWGVREVLGDGSYHQDIDWHSSPGAERAAREQYATERDKGLCITGCEVDIDDLDESGDEPLCSACVAKLAEEFRAAPMRCESCDWTGTGADILSTDEDLGHQCPGCGEHDAKEVTP